MRRLSRGRLARALASILIGLFAGPTLLGWGLALPAMAQITPQAQLELVGVVPFQNLTNVQTEVLGDKATAAVQQSLLDTQTYDVRPLEETRQKMADLGLRPPLNETDFDRLGEAEGVGGIVFGEIRSAGVRSISRSSQGEVVLMVAIYDVPSRTLRAGTIVTGQSSPATGEINAEALVQEALNQAAYQAVKQIQSHRPITGMVQWAKGKDVQINIGETQGALETMKFVVLRNGQRVGIIEVGRPQRTFSDARLVDGQARTEDRIREIFVVPAKGKVAELPLAKKEKKRGMNKLMLALLAGAFVLGLSQSRGGKSAAENVTASAVSNVVDTALDTIPTGDLFFGDFAGSGAAIQVRWSSPRNAKEIIHGYEIWRDGQLHWVELGPSGAGRIFNDPLTSPSNTTTITITIDPVTGTGRTDGPSGTARPSFGVNVQPSLFLADYALDNAVAPTKITYTLPSDFVDKVITVGTTNVTVIIYLGPRGGEHHNYQVRKITSQRTGSLAEQNFEIVRESLLSREVIATFIGPPPLELPADGELVADPTAVIFAFHPVPGADDFILQVSLDSLFTPGATVSDNLTNLDAPQDPAVLLLVTKDLTTLLGSLPAGTRVFWRVGARYRGDSTMPLPYPAIGRAPADSFRYVFSRARNVVIP